MDYKVGDHVILIKSQLNIGRAEYTPGVITQISKNGIRMDSEFFWMRYIWINISDIIPDVQYYRDNKISDILD